MSLAMVAALAPSLSALQEGPQDLADLSIEDLMKIDVTSVSKGRRKLLDVPAAVTVIALWDSRKPPAGLRHRPMGRWFGRASVYAITMKRPKREGLVRAFLECFRQHHDP